MPVVDLSISAIDLEARGVLNLGQVTYPPRGSYGPRVQRDHQLVLLLTGALTIRIDGVPHMVRPGHVVLLHPGHEERVQRDAGVTPVRYLWQQRTCEGIYLLQHTGLTVTEIACHVGFQTPYHFARLVRQMAGKSPTELRRVSWQGDRDG